MKQILALIAAAVLASSAAAHGGDHKPQHGGIVVEHKDVDYELVARPDSIRLFLRGHQRVDVAQAGARLKLLTGSATQDVELKPAGDRLEAAGRFNVAAGTKVVALVTIAGRPAGTVRFVLK